MDHQLIPTIVDCDCGLRYMRTAVRTVSFEIGHKRCACGSMLGAWNGQYRLIFDSEEAPEPES